MFGSTSKSTVVKLADEREAPAINGAYTFPIDGIALSAIFSFALNKTMMHTFGNDLKTSTAASSLVIIQYFNGASILGAVILCKTFHYYPSNNAKNCKCSTFQQKLRQSQ